MRMIGTALIWLSAGVYLLTLEAVRLANAFSAEMALMTDSIFSLALVVCTLLFAVGIPLRYHSRQTSKKLALVGLSIVILVLGIPALGYLTYFIPYASTLVYTPGDWIMVLILLGMASFCLVMCVSRFVRLLDKGGPTNQMQ